MGATAAAGAKAAMRPPEKRAKTKRPARPAKPAGSPGDRAMAAAVADYLRAKNKLLTATGCASVETALVRGAAAVKRVDDAKRAARVKAQREQQAIKDAKSAQKVKKRTVIFDSDRLPVDEIQRSSSVRTVSGGAPGLGRRR